MSREYETKVLYQINEQDILAAVGFEAAIVERLEALVEVLEKIEKALINLQRRWR